MKLSVKDLCINMGVTLVTLLALAFFFEFVVFKYVLKASDYPELAYENDIIKFAPSQTGVYRLHDEIASTFRINENGWNSGKPAYVNEKRLPRIAVIGDSYISALQIDFDASVAERLETLGAGRFEVYRFGIDGAPLSQYLHILRKEAIRYNPDIVIFNLVHNDFTESYNVLQGVYTSAFMHLVIDDDKVVGEVEPQPFVRRWYSPIRSSNAWRYLSMRKQVRLQALRDVVLGRQQDGKTPRYEGNIDVATLENKADRNLVATEYVFRQAKQLCEKNGAEFMVVMDGVRGLIYATPDGPFDRSQGALQLNAVVEEAGRRIGVPVVDLHEKFAVHYRENRQRFEFEHDGHWNELGHGLAAQAVYDDLTRRGVLAGQ